MYVCSNAATEVYDDVISEKTNQQSYETILNKDYEEGVGTAIKAVNTRYIAKI